MPLKEAIKIRYGQIRKYDVANGPGIRTSLFVTGCPFKCKGCFNQEYQSFENGEPFTPKTEDKLFAYLKDPHVSGLSILGGEPLAQGHEILQLIKKVKSKLNANIWIWTGFIYEDLDELQNEIISYANVLVDGPFIESKRDLKLKFRGSSNQRIIDLNKTCKQNKLILWE